ncbi:MAG: hypothetical protein ACK41O_23370 [Runella zeae]
MSLEELREQPYIYVAAANLFDVLVRIKAKADDMRLFGGDVFKLSMSRAEALAFDVWFNPHDWDSDEEVATIGTTVVKPQTFEYGLLVRICGLINQKYYV